MNKLTECLSRCETYRQFERILTKIHNEEGYDYANSIFAAFCSVLLKLENDGPVHRWEGLPNYVKEEFDLPSSSGKAVDFMRRHANGNARGVKCIFRSKHSRSKVVKYAACVGHVAFVASYQVELGCFMSNGEEFPEVFHHHPKYETYLVDYFDNITRRQMKEVKELLQKEGFDEDSSSEEESDRSFVVDEEESDGEFVPDEEAEAESSGSEEVEEVEDSDDSDSEEEKREMAAALRASEHTQVAYYKEKLERESVEDISSGDDFVPAAYHPIDTSHNRKRAPAKRVLQFEAESDESEDLDNVPIASRLAKLARPTRY